MVLFNLADFMKTKNVMQYSHSPISFHLALKSNPIFAKSRFSLAWNTNSNVLHGLLNDKMSYHSLLSWIIVNRVVYYYISAWIKKAMCDKEIEMYFFITLSFNKTQTTLVLVNLLLVFSNKFMYWFLVIYDNPYLP